MSHAHHHNEHNHHMEPSSVIGALYADFVGRILSMITLLKAIVIHASMVFVSIAMYMYAFLSGIEALKKPFVWAISVFTAAYLLTTFTLLPFIIILFLVVYAFLYDEKKVLGIAFGLVIASFFYSMLI